MLLVYFLRFQLRFGGPWKEPSRPQPARMDVPLWCAVAASNELPESDELDALFDR